MVSLPAFIEVLRYSVHVDPESVYLTCCVVGQRSHFCDIIASLKSSMPEKNTRCISTGPAALALDKFLLNKLGKPPLFSVKNLGSSAGFMIVADQESDPPRRDRSKTYSRYTPETARRKPGSSR